MVKTTEKAPAVARTAGRGGRFVKGSSGNPAGRPAGSRNKTTVLCADLLGGDAEKIMAKCIARAKLGEPVALRLCIERLIPVQGSRDRYAPMKLPAVLEAGDLVAAAAAVIAQAAAGTITLSEAKEFMGLLDAQRRTIETTELSVRIDALEGAAPGGGFSPCVPDPRDGLGARVLRRVRACVDADRLEAGAAERYADREPFVKR